MLVSGYDLEAVQAARKICIKRLRKALKKAALDHGDILGEGMVTHIIPAVTNGSYFFMIVPDGFKEDWSAHMEVTLAKEKIINKITKDALDIRILEVVDWEMGAPTAELKFGYNRGF